MKKRGAGTRVVDFVADVAALTAPAVVAVIAVAAMLMAMMEAAANIIAGAV